MLPRVFKSKAEVIAFVSSLGIEEAILLGNLWIEIKNKVTALEQNDIVVAAEVEKKEAILVREKEILDAKSKEIKELEDAILTKDALLLDKNNEVKRGSHEICKLQEDKENEKKMSNEQLARKGEELRQYAVSLQKRDEEINSIRLSFNLEKQELKLDKDRSNEDLKARNVKQAEENDKKIIELQSYIRAKEDELAKSRVANENFMMNKFEVTFGRFIEKAKTSAGTGLMGEEFVEQVLSKIGFGIHYENVARWGHQGDFKITFPKSQVTILLEVKNFSETQTSLPKKDIDKFFMDLKEPSYHAGILLSLNSQCKMDTEDLCIQDDLRSKKKYMFLSKFISMVKGDHVFALQLALNIIANAVLSSRSNRDDLSKEMLTFIKSQLEFMRLQYKAAQAAEKEATKMAMNLRDNINKITRQIADWETPKRSNRIQPEFQDQANYNSPTTKDVAPFTPPHNSTKENLSYGILAKPISLPNSPWEKRSIVTGESSPRTPKLNLKRNAEPSETIDFNSDRSEKIRKITLSKSDCENDIRVGEKVNLTPAKKEHELRPNIDDHGFLKFTSATPGSKLTPHIPESQLILPNDTDEIFKDIQI